MPLPWSHMETHVQGGLTYSEASYPSKEAELILIPSCKPVDSCQHQLRSGTVLPSLSLLLADFSLWLIPTATKDRTFVF